MRLFQKCCTTALFFLLTTIVLAQTPPQGVAKDPFNNPVILSHYTVADLQQLSPKKLRSISYYYTQSYILDSIACSDCRTFDRIRFDVSQFEQFRMQNTRYVREYTKYGYRLTLLSRDELLYEPIR